MKEQYINQINVFCLIEYGFLKCQMHNQFIDYSYITRLWKWRKMIHSGVNNASIQVAIFNNPSNN